MYQEFESEQITISCLVNYRIVREVQVGTTHEVVPVFQVASNGDLPSSIALGGPLAPVERIRSPRCHVVAGSLWSVLRREIEPSRHAVRQTGVCARPDVCQAEGRVRYVPL